MIKIYDFFGIAKPNGMILNWDSRMESTAGNSVKVYDRYDVARGLHKEVKKDKENI